MNPTANGVLPTPSTVVSVPLRKGPPTREELLFHYPAKFTWNQLKTFVNSGDLGLLKRDRELQERYFEWADGIIAEHGSMVKYLMNHRLRWGQPDVLSLLKSSLVDYRFTTLGDNLEVTNANDNTSAGPPPPYFTWETPLKYISIIQNDWPYSVPPEIEHTLIWTKVPIYHSDLVSECVRSRIEQDGLWGFTGNESPPPSPSNLSTCLPLLAEWGITKETMIRSAPATFEEQRLIEYAGKEVLRYVQNRWSEDEWETAWFVNPPRLQSVPGLDHVHVFARQK